MQETQALYEEHLTPLLKQSFEYHDDDGNGVLDKKEAKQLFRSFVSEMSQFVKINSLAFLLRTMDMRGKMMGPEFETTMQAETRDHS